MVGHKLSLNIKEEKQLCKIFFPSHNKVKNQLQKETWKIHTFVEITLYNQWIKEEIT